MIYYLRVWYKGVPLQHKPVISITAFHQSMSLYHRLPTDSDLSQYFGMSKGRCRSLRINDRAGVYQVENIFHVRRFCQAWQKCRPQFSNVFLTCEHFGWWDYDIFRLSDRLRSLFVLFAGVFTKHAAEVLSATNVAKTGGCFFYCFHFTRVVSWLET